MPRGPPKISRAMSGASKAAVIEQPEFWLRHQAVLASILASSSMTGTYSGSNSSAPSSERGNTMRNSPRSISASTISWGSSRSRSISAAAAASFGAISPTRAT